MPNLLSTLITILSNTHLILSQAPGAKQPHWCPPGHPYKGGPLIGAYGQDCTPDQGDCPGACPVTGQTLKAVNGKIECQTNFDCCNCGLIECGTAAKPDCTELNCNADSGCYGAKNIVMHGSGVGAIISCNGDLSCKETIIEGYEISVIGCTGDQACQYARMWLTCIKAGCILECVGDNSCSADALAPYSAVFDITNSAGMSCSAGACKYGYFMLKQNVGGFISCSAYDSCKGSVIVADGNIGSLSCAGEDACRDSIIYITNPTSGFSVFCGSSFACANMEIYIIITDPTIKSIGGIECNAVSSCEGMKLQIQTQLPYPKTQKLTVPSLTCQGPKSCKNVKVIKSTNVEFTSCFCATSSIAADAPCDGLTGLAGKC